MNWLLWILSVALAATGLLRVEKCSAQSGRTASPSGAVGARRICQCANVPRSRPGRRR
jgi:hypothetical protein